MKELFKEKYLKYSPEITLEIFTLVWDKLISLGYYSCNFISAEYRYEEFIKKNPYFRENSEIPLELNCYAVPRAFKETTVQEILGYDPFVKDDFVLPRKWCCEINHKSREIFNKWRKTKARHLHCEMDATYTYITEDGSCNHSKINTEITFDQFQKYVLKIEEQPKVTGKDWSKATEEEILEEAKCRYPIGCKVKLIGVNVGGNFNNEVRFTKHKVYNSSKGKQLFVDGNLLLFDKTWAKIISLPEVNSTLGVNLIDTSSFKPSTKEAFDAQDKTKPIEKWSVGSYVVIVNQANGILLPAGTVEIIHEETLDCIGVPGDHLSKDREKSNEIKWFATKSEAEEFAKTLIQPVKEEVKQPLKQAVHCKTREEWDFVLSKFNPKSLPNSRFDSYSDDTVIIISDQNNSSNIGTYGSVSCQKKDYQILSFQEWCDLNGYKMEKELKQVAGVWYKWIKHSNEKDGLKYVKSNYFSENTLQYLERINVDGTHVYIKSHCVWDEELVEVNLSEIQQYLPEGHPDKISSTKDTIILNESCIGKYISFSYHGQFYDKAFITEENVCIYVLNNCHSNNDGHKDKSKYKYSLKFTSIERMFKYCEDIKFLDFESIKVRPLCPDDLTWEIQVPQIKTHGIMWCEPAPMTKDNWKHKMILSIDDEELPMVSVIKTNTIKHLLNIE